MAIALENLSLVATSDHNIVANIIAINKKLVETSTMLFSQVKSLVAKNAWLANTQVTESQKPSRATITRQSVTIDPNGHCWDHGFKVRMGHSSIKSAESYRVISMIRHKSTH